MKKAITVTLDDQEIVDLIQIMLDEDAEAALAFVKRHFKSKAKALLTTGLKKNSTQDTDSPENDEH
jgi:uncharacterized glyoxalase superfamily protein PhnB